MYAVFSVSVLILDEQEVTQRSVTVLILCSGPTAVLVQEVSRSCSDRTREDGFLGTTGPKERGSGSGSVSEDLRS